MSLSCHEVKFRSLIIIGAHEPIVTFLLEGSVCRLLTMIYVAKKLAIKIYLLRSHNTVCLSVSELIINRLQ